MDNIVIERIITDIDKVIPVVRINEKAKVKEQLSYMPPVYDDTNLNDVNIYSQKTDEFMDKLSDTARRNEDEFNKELKACKQKAVKIVLNNMLNEYIYYSNGGFTERELCETGLYDQGERLCEDLVVSEMEGISFRRADVFSTSQDIITQYSALYEFDYKKTFSNDVILLNSISGRMKPGYKKTKTLNKDFNKTYKILTKKKYDSLLILTPHVMEYLISFNQKHNGNIELSFINYKLYIKINGQNLFATTQRIYILEEKRILESIKEIEGIREIVSFLKSIAFVGL